MRLHRITSVLTSFSATIIRLTTTGGNLIHTILGSLAHSESICTVLIRVRIFSIALNSHMSVQMVTKILKFVHSL